MKGLIPKVIRIFLTYGIKSVTIYDLASELGISMKVPYQHSDDKAMVIANCIDHLLDGRAQSLMVRQKIKTATR